MNGQTRRFSMLTDGLLFLLLAIFALFSTLLVLVGAQAYRNTVAAASAHNDARILTNYIAFKARMNDRAGAIRIESTSAGDALVFKTETSDEAFETYIYCHDGALRELTLFADGEFLPEDGEALASAARLTAEIGDGLLTAEVLTESGERYEARVSLRCV